MADLKESGQAIADYIQRYAMSGIDVIPCTCGAYTIHNDLDNETIAFSRNTRKSVAPYLKPTMHKMDSCNHCANKWGIDL